MTIYNYAEKYSIALIGEIIFFSLALIVFVFALFLGGVFLYNFVFKKQSHILINKREGVLWGGIFVIGITFFVLFANSILPSINDTLYLNHCYKTNNYQTICGELMVNQVCCNEYRGEKNYQVIISIGDSRIYASNIFNEQEYSSLLDYSGSNIQIAYVSQDVLPLYDEEGNYMWSTDCTVLFLIATNGIGH